MAANQPLWPRAWLMTDERIGDRLWQAIDRLPNGGGIVFRHYGLERGRRVQLGRRIASVAKTRQLTLAVGRDRNLAAELDASLVHNPRRPGSLPSSFSVHDEGEALAAKAAGAALVFISPIFPTQSHLDARSLGPQRAIELAALSGCPAIALGGMDEGRFAALSGRGFLGYAGIDCWLRT